MEILDDGASDDRPRGHAQAVDAAPYADGQLAQAPRNGVGHQRQGQGADSCPAGALDDSGGDQCGRRGRQRRYGRGEGEQEDRPQEQPAATDSVARSGGRQDEGGVGERVGVDEPLELGDRGVQVLMDLRQSDGDDE